MDLRGKTCNPSIQACASTKLRPRHAGFWTAPKPSQPPAIARRLAGLLLAMTLAGCAVWPTGLRWTQDKKSAERPPVQAEGPNPAVSQAEDAKATSSGEQNGGQSENTDTGLGQHDYVYNLPHQVPADYVYRTERIFTAEGRTAPAAERAGAPGDDRATPEETEHFVTAVRALATTIVRQAEVETDAQVIVATFVNLDNLYRTSGLGRLLQETTIGALRQAGLSVIDPRKTPSILVRQRFGEYGLSRDLEEIPYVHLADAVLVGTYRQAAGQLFISARLLDNTDNRVLGSAETVLPVSALPQDLLADEKAVPTRNTVAVPVRKGGLP